VALHGAYLSRVQREDGASTIPFVSSTESDKETNQVNRQASSAVRLASALVIAGIVVVACGRHGSPQAQPVAQDPAASPVTAVATFTPEAVQTPDVAVTAAPSDSAAPVATYAPPAPANDPVTGEILSIDQLLGGLDGSLSGADSGSAGGE
jgi:hypothetical protein